MSYLGQKYTLFFCDQSGQTAVEIGRSSCGSSLSKRRFRDAPFCQESVRPAFHRFTANFFEQSLRASQLWPTQLAFCLRINQMAVWLGNLWLVSYRKAWKTNQPILIFMHVFRYCPPQPWAQDTAPLVTFPSIPNKHRETGGKKEMAKKSGFNETLMLEMCVTLT